MAIQNLEYTVADAAKRFGRTRARIRQVCQELDAGRLINPRLRLLYDEDMEALEKYFSEHGKNSTNSD